MSVNSPPNPNVSTFNNLYWISGDSSLTQSQADLRYLKFPVAQGTENLQTTNINGVLTTNSSISAYKPITMSSTTATDRIIYNTYYKMVDNVTNLSNGEIYSTNGNWDYDNDANSGTHRFYNNDAGGVQVNTLSIGSVAVTANTDIVQSGATNNIVQDITTNTDQNSLKATQIYGDLSLRKPTSATGGGLRLYDIIAGVNSSQIYTTGTQMALVNLNPSGSTTITTTDGAGVQTQALQISSTAITANEKLTMNGVLNTDRIISNVYYQLQDANSLGSVLGQIYAGSGVFNYDNDANGGSHNFATNNSSGVQTIPLSLNSNAITASTSLILNDATNGISSIIDQDVNSLKIAGSGNTLTPSSLIQFYNTDGAGGVNIETMRITNALTQIFSPASFESATPPVCAASSTLATSDNSTKLPSTAWVRSYVTSVVPVAPTTFTSTASTTGYNSGGNYTYWYFTSFPSWTAFSWVFNTPLASRTFLGKNGLGSSPPLNVGTIGSNGSFILMTGTGVYQGYSASSSTMITYCNGYQQQYTIGTSANAAILSVVNCIGATAGSPIFQSNQLTENGGTCPPSANGLSGYIILQVLNGDYTGLGTPTLKFTQLIA